MKLSIIQVNQRMINLTILEINLIWIMEVILRRKEKH